MNKLRTAATCAFAVFAMGSACAESADPALSGPQTGATVLTRARVVARQVEIGNKAYVRLKLLPRAKLPFTTQAFRLRDHSLMADVPEGASVKFSARHVDGENVLTAIQVVPECVRFQPCD